MLLEHIQHTLRQRALRQTVNHNCDMLRIPLKARHDLRRLCAICKALSGSRDFLRGSVRRAEIRQLRLRICFLDDIVPQKD